MGMGRGEYAPRRKINLFREWRAFCGGEKRRRRKRKILHIAHHSILTMQ
jgi:hypothetical protein